MFLPQVLFLNVLEMSQFHPALRIDEVLEEQWLNSESSGGRLRLLAVVHVSSGSGGRPVYYLTLRVKEVWVQAFGDKYEVVSGGVESILNFENKDSEIELLVYQRE